MSVTTDELREMQSAGIMLTEDGRERIRISDELAAAKADDLVAREREARIAVNKAAKTYASAQAKALELLGPTAEAFATARNAARTYKGAQARARALGIRDLPIVDSIGLQATRQTDEGRALRKALDAFARDVHPGGV